MPITGLQLITVTGKYLLLNGSPASGKVTFRPSTVITNSAANEIVYPNIFTVVLNGSGAFSVQLPATDDPDLAPQGWTYEVTENINGTEVSRVYDIELPFDDADSTIDLADVAPAFEVPLVTAYALVGHEHPHDHNGTYVQVRDIRRHGFNATPGADNTAVVQTALDAGPGTVLITTGTTVNVTNISIPGSVTLFLEGSARLKASGRITFRQDPNGAAQFQDGAAAIEGTSMDTSMVELTGNTNCGIKMQNPTPGSQFATNCRLRNIKIRSTGTCVDPMVELRTAQTVLVENVRVDAAPGPVGSYVFDLWQTINCYFKHVIISGGILRSGVRLDGDSDFNVFQSCRINGSYQAGSYGIYMDAAYALNHVVDCEVSRWGVGIQVGVTVKMALCRIINNFFEDNVSHDVVVGHASLVDGSPRMVVIQGNFFYSDSGVVPDAVYGIWVQRALGIRILDNYAPFAQPPIFIRIEAPVTGYEVKNNFRELGTNTYSIDPAATPMPDSAAALLPWVIQIDPLSGPPFSSSNWSTHSHDVDCDGGGHLSSSGDTNAHVTYKVVLGAGTWAIDLKFRAGPDHGIYHIALDDVEVGTIDSYTAVLTPNTRASVTGVAVATAGVKTLRLRMESKHASSSQPWANLQKLALRRTA